MILKSFILDNLVSLCMKIINSVVVVGLYYGFLTTFSIGPSYLFLLRARVMEEGTEKKVSATTGFITGQLMMFISIYYAPLHLALGRPHTITVIALPYLLFHFFCNNHKHFLNYGSTNQNSMRNFSIQRIFLNNLIFQLLNLFILPSSMLVRLVNIYMFRCNNQFLFLTSSFVGWLIGHILFMKWVGLILVWIQKNNSIKSNVLIRSNKYIISELRNFMSRIFIIFLFISSIYYLGRTPLPIFIKNKKISEIQERGEIDNKKKIGVERTSKTKVTKQEQKKSNAEYLSASLFSKERENSYKIDEREEKDIFRLEKPLLRIIFDYKRFHRPLRYIKNDQFENAVRNEMSQFFFHTCQSDAKEKISFTYPSSLSTFLEMMQRKTSLFTTEKLSYDELDNRWSSINEQKRNNLRNQFLNRAEALDKEFFALDVLEKKSRLCNDETKKKYLPKIYDPFLNGPYRGRIKKSFLFSIKNKTYPKNYIWINKIHAILLNINTDYPGFEQKIDRFDKKSLSNEIRFFFNLISQFSGKSVSNFNFKGLCLFREHEKMDSEAKKKKMKFLFDAILTDANDKTIINRKKCIGIKESSKKVPRWSYKLIDEVEHLETSGETADYEIRSRKAKRVVIFTDDSENANAYTDTKDTDNSDEKDELALIRYSQQPDFRRDIIKGSRRAQRRKTVNWKIFQASAHSPLFLDKIDKPSFFSFDIFEPMKILFLNWMWKNKNTELKISDSTEEKTKEIKKKEEERRIEIAEAWDSIIYAQVIRGFLLVTQSIIRKYILLPSLIITKNIVRILLFQSPEWSEDLKDWNREMYIKCTYNGVQLSETEFPKNWLTEGIQIKVLFPFRLKPWHRYRSKLRSPQKEKDPMKKKVKKMDFFFLTVFGMEVELPFSSSPRNRRSFFDPIFKELKKKIKIWKKNFFLVLKVLNERTKFFLNIAKETAQRIIQSIRKRILFLKEKIKKLSLSNLLFIFGLRKIYELNEIQKDSTKSKSKRNQIIYESTIPIQSINWTDCSLTEKKIKDLNDRTKKIIKQIEKFKKDKKKGSERNICSKKTTYDDKRLELQKNIWQILQKRNVRLSRKSHYFFKFFIERVYIDIFVCIINIPRINVQLFLESTKKNSYKIHLQKRSKGRKKKKGEKKSKSNSLYFYYKKINLKYEEYEFTEFLRRILFVTSICILQIITNPSYKLIYVKIKIRFGISWNTSFSEEGTKGLSFWSTRNISFQIKTKERSQFCNESMDKLVKRSLSIRFISEWMVKISIPQMAKKNEGTPCGSKERFNQISFIGTKRINSLQKTRNRFINKSKKKNEKTIWVRSFIIKIPKLCRKEGLIYLWIKIVIPSKKKPSDFLKFQHAKKKKIGYDGRYSSQELYSRRFYSRYGKKFGKKVFGLENSEFLSYKESAFLGFDRYRLLFYASGRNQPIQEKKKPFGLDGNECRNTKSLHSESGIFFLLENFYILECIYEKPMDHTNQIPFFQFKCKKKGEKHHGKEKNRYFETMEKKKISGIRVRDSKERKNRICRSTKSRSIPFKERKRCKRRLCQIRHKKGCKKKKIHEQHRSRTKLLPKKVFAFSIELAGLLKGKNNEEYPSILSPAETEKYKRNCYSLYSKRRTKSRYYENEESEGFHSYRIEKKYGIDEKRNIEYRTDSSVYKKPRTIQYVSNHRPFVDSQEKAPNQSKIPRKKLRRQEKFGKIHKEIHYKNKRSKADGKERKKELGFACSGKSFIRETSERIENSNLFQSEEEKECAEKYGILQGEKSEKLLSSFGYKKKYRKRKTKTNKFKVISLAKLSIRRFSLYESLLVRYQKWQPFQYGKDTYVSTIENSLIYIFCFFYFS
ncbi:hypothetical chloroplast RF19 (chloroplast) [Prosopis cineraria]|uniref:Protein TIC 214 n=1 Tax=Prosopis cineraria TaxID=364024 RepID=A0A7D4Z966_9FABA|nr:hypothetical chloroplast RF19 [Prosopis cineraria]QKS32531.1 hypothetical chloroplast RF19 [Prosopis cineraria]